MAELRSGGPVLSVFTARRYASAAYAVTESVAWFIATAETFSVESAYWRCINISLF